MHHRRKEYLSQWMLGGKYYLHSVIIGRERRLEVNALGFFRIIFEFFLHLWLSNYRTKTVKLNQYLVSHSSPPKNPKPTNFWNTSLNWMQVLLLELAMNKLPFCYCASLLILHIFICTYVFLKVVISKLWMNFELVMWTYKYSYLMNSLFCLNKMWCANLSLEVTPLLFLFHCLWTLYSITLSLSLWELSLLFILELHLTHQWLYGFWLGS